MRFGVRAAVAVAAYVITTTGVSSLAGEIAGRRVSQFGSGVHESFIWVNGVGNNSTTAHGIGFSWTGDYTIKNLPGGSYYLIANEHGTAPFLIRETPVNVPASGSVNVPLRDWHTMGSTGLTDLGACLWAAQTFVATGADLAMVSLVSPSGGSLVRLTVHQDDPFGAQIGPARVFTNGSLFPAGARWAPGELPLIPGRTYAVRFSSPNATLWRPALSYRVDEYPNGHAWIDGEPIPEAELSVSIQCRDTGFIDGYRVDNWWRPNTYTEYVQTFVASGPELRLASIMLAGQQSYVMRASVHQWSGAYPPGPQIGFAKHAQMSANLTHGFVWGPAELPLTTGTTYAIRFVRVDGQPYPVYGDTNAYAAGQAYFDGVPENGIDVTGRLVFKEPNRGNIQISNLVFTPVSATQVRATFTTDIAAFATIVYREGSPVFETIVPAGNVSNTSHELLVSGLKPSTSYQMSILAFNAGRNVLRTGDVTVTTPAQTALLSGHVVSQVGPVQGAEVVLKPSGLKTATDSLGRFSFPTAPTGNHLIEVHALGRVGDSQSVELTPAGSTSSVIEMTAYSNLLAGTDDNPLAGWTKYGKFDGEWNSGQWSVSARSGPKWVGSVGNYSPKTGGIFRSVPVIPDRMYRFGGFIQTRAYGHAQADPIDGLAVARIGVDPTGGTNPASPNVIWARYRFTGGQWMELGLNFVPQANTVTLFAEHKWEDFYLIPPWFIVAFDDLWIGSVLPRIPDFDHDGDVDQVDFGHFQACLTGSGFPQTDVLCFDTRLDADEDVDLDDFAVFQRCVSGANQPFNAGCAD